MILGITGGTGCGKTTLLHLLQDRGGVVFDCDELYHTLLQTDASLLRAIEARFPGTVQDGVLQRKKLGAIVFSQEQALLDLNAITHSAVCREVQRKLEAHPPLAAIDAIALIESGLSRLCDVTVGVTAPEQARIARLMDRDGITAQYAVSRIHAQHENGWFAENCDYVLCNDSTEGAFREKCLAFFQEIGIL